MYRWHDISVSAESNTALSSDAALRALSVNGQATVTVISARDVVNEAIYRHGLSATAAMGLGRALIGTLLLSSFQKTDEQINTIFRSVDGSAGKMNVIGKSDGQVRGYISDPAVNPPRKQDGSLNVPAAVGTNGSLAVIRSHPEYSEPYTGIVPLHNGEVGEDIVKYIHESEQTNAAMGIGISLDHSMGAKHAGGWLVQTLPFADEGTTSSLERNIETIQRLGGTTRSLEDGLTPEELAMKLMAGYVLGGNPGDMEAQLEDAARLTPTYGPCEQEGPNGLKARMRRAVASLGNEEIESIIKERGCVEVYCHYCSETVQFHWEDFFPSEQSA